MKTLKRNPWYIAAGCFLQMFLGMGLCSSFSMMLPEISAHTGISTGSISGNLTVASGILYRFHVLFQAAAPEIRRQKAPDLR